MLRVHHLLPNSGSGWLLTAGGRWSEERRTKLTQPRAWLHSVADSGLWVGFSLAGALHGALYAFAYMDMPRWFMAEAPRRCNTGCGWELGALPAPQPLTTDMIAPLLPAATSTFTRS